MTISFDRLGGGMPAAGPSSAAPPAPAGIRAPAFVRRLVRGLVSGLAAAALAGCAASVPAPVLLTLPPAVTGAGAAPADGPGAPAASGDLPTVPATGAASPRTAGTLPSPPTVATPAPRLVAVRRVGVPEYLLARRVRFRADASTVAEWPNTFWAERIEVGATRELVAALRAHLPGWGICEASCGDAVPAVVVQADWSPLDHLRGARRLEARARIVLSGGGAAGRVLAVREFAWTIPAGADTPQAQAEAITEATRRLAASTAPLLAAAVPQP